MIQNIYGNSASPLQGEFVGPAPDPTLRIGLISDVPPAQDDERNRPNPTLRIGLTSGAPLERIIRSAARAAVLIVVAMLLSSCSTGVVYEPQSITATSPNAININTASTDELEKLPHIGRKTAEAIVDHRERHGAFRRVEHLMLIRGMSETRFAEIQTLIRTE